MRLKRLLSRLFQPPKWAREAQAAFDAWDRHNKAFIAMLDRDLKAYGSAPRLAQGTDPFLPEETTR